MFMKRRDQSSSWWESFRDWRYRKVITAAVLAVLGVSYLMSVAESAKAAECTTMGSVWKVQEGNIRFTVAEARFGATVCWTGKGYIASVRPYMEGASEGAGVVTGVSWTNLGATYDTIYAVAGHVYGTAKSRMCVIRELSVCSATSTHHFHLFFSGRDYHYFEVSSEWCSLTGCANSAHFKRVA